MKARVLSIAKVVLSYGVSGTDLDTLTEVVSKYGASVRLVMPTELDTKVRHLLEPSKLNLETYPQDTPKLILMSGMDKPTMDTLLDDLKSHGVNIPLRVMLTPANQHWYFRELLKYVSEEHQLLTNNS
jgi:hypothetical protein